jgi:hypothetical protein
LPTADRASNSGIVTSGLRFATFFQVDLFSDPTYLVVETMTWTCVEPGVYLIAATLPSLRPLVVPVLASVNLSNVYSRVRSLSWRASEKQQTNDSPLIVHVTKGFSGAEASVASSNRSALMSTEPETRAEAGYGGKYAGVGKHW